MKFYPQPSIPNPSHGAGRSYFFDKIKRNEAERLLEPRPIGEFVVRSSETSASNFLSITVKAPGRIRHFKIAIHSNGDCVIGQRKFNSMEELLQYYKHNPIYSDKDQGNVFLTTPVPR